MFYKQIVGFAMDRVMSIQRSTDNAFIPCDPANTDYQKFKTDVADGAELQDPDGNVMTQAEADAFLETLP